MLSSQEIIDLLVKKINYHREQQSQWGLLKSNSQNDESIADYTKWEKEESKSRVDTKLLLDIIMEIADSPY
jgi:hypothetical protein